MRGQRFRLRRRIRSVATRTLWRSLPPIRAWVARRKRLAGFAQGLLDRFAPLQDAFLALAHGDPQNRYRLWVAEYDTLEDADLSAVRDDQSKLADPPLLSLVVPLAHTIEAMLEELAGSLLAQVYERWEVEFVGEATVDERAGTLLAQAPSRDARFRPLREGAAPLAEAWNTALRSVASDVVVLVDPRVALRPHALFLLAHTIERHPDAMLVYGDEDVIDETGSRSGHYFKPDWNEALLRSQNYLGGLVAFRRSHALAVGGFQDELDGDCAWGLFLRMTADVPPGAIQHLPFILTHRHAEQRAPDRDDGAERERVARAHEERLARIGQRVRVEPAGESSYRADYALPREPPTVSVIVPSTCKLDVLRPCLDGVLSRTSYPQVELMLVANGLRKMVPERRAYLDTVAARPQARVLYDQERPYNFSRLNNRAAEQARGELLCFLNDDTEVIGSDWLSAMVARVLQDRVGAVGAKLYYPNGRIQHAGVLLGSGGVAAHTYGGRRRDTLGYHDRAVIDQDVSCVTAACMLVKRDVFLSIGGFDEALAIAFNDVDFCLRLREAGWRIVWTPSAELYHRESASIGRHDAGEREAEWISEANLIRGRWGEHLMSDPHHSPNLCLDPLLLWQPAFPPRVSYPWRAGGSTESIPPAAALSVRSA